MNEPTANGLDAESPPGRGLGRRNFLGGAGAAALTIGLATDAFVSRPQPAFAADIPYQHPFPKWTISDPFGSWDQWRQDQGLGPHRGTDYAPGSGLAVTAVADGVVVRVGWHDALGSLVCVRHPDGIYSGYSHLGYGSQTVGVGAAVTRGQTLGVVGSTGLSTGPHLHLTMSSSSDHPAWGTVFDPVPYIDARVNVAEPVPTPRAQPSPFPRRNNNMASLYYKTENGVLWALAGDGRGEAAWLETHLQSLANHWAGQHGTAALLSHDTFVAFKARYLSPDPVRTV